MERVFGTLQKRLPPELRLAGIKTVAAANRYLKERFVPDYNARFAVPAAEPGSAFVPYAGRPLEDVLCVQEDRQVGRDNCVQWKGAGPADPAPAPPPSLRQSHRARARISRRPSRHLRRAALPGPLRPQRRADRCLTGRLTPLGAPEPVDVVDNAPALPTPPQANRQLTEADI